MIDTEDSVVTSLNELRRLKNERRQSKQRSAVFQPRSHEVDDTAADSVTPPPSPIHAAPAPVTVYPTFAPAPQVITPAHSFAPPVSLAAPKSSATPAIIVAAVLIAGGIAGYMKIQGDMQTQLAAKSVEVRDAEEARNKAVESLARMEQQGKANLQKCEEKLKLATATPSRSMAPGIAPAAVDSGASSRPSKPVFARSSSRSSRRVAAAAPAEPAAPKPASVPTIAKKKVLVDDPLAGLGRP